MATKKPSRKASKSAGRSSKAAKERSKPGKPRPAARVSAARSAARAARGGRSATALASVPGLATVAELVELRELARVADDTLETCARDRLSLRATMERFLPAVAGRLGAIAAYVQTRNETLADDAFEHGDWSERDRLLIGPATARGAVASEDGKRTVIAQVLDVAGQKVGVAAFLFEGDRMRAAADLAARVDAVCEELDGVLAAIQQAAEKQELILEVGKALRNLVFERGVEDALTALRRSVPLDDFALLYRDEAAASPDTSIRYRVYRDGICTHDVDNNPDPRLEEAIARLGDGVLERDRELAALLSMRGAVETVLISGITSQRVLGRILAGAKNGLSTFALDLLRVFAELISQRLVDYNRERRHLSQFFSSGVINELLRDPAYEERYLSPRTDEVALVYADINSFTKISEQVLLDPARISRFVDRWSAGAVDILWKHGGVFDKMVGDCVIGIFGPPFFRTDPKARIAAALKAAREILSFTISLESDPELAGIVESGVVRGLGVAVGVNLCPASVGLFGPNQDFTAFSSGMNQTARLQALAGFREILVMDHARDVLGELPEGLRDLSLEGPIDSPVKNVARPLRYYRVSFPESTRK